MEFGKLGNVSKYTFFMRVGLKTNDLGISNSFLQSSYYFIQKRGVVEYSMSPYEQKAFAGFFKKGAPQLVRR